MRARMPAPLTVAECEKPRTPRELRAWVLAKCNAFRQIPDLRETVLMRSGQPMRDFYQEIYPLSVFVLHQYGDRDDIVCVPRLDRKSNVDAEIRIRESSRRINIQITSARDPEEHLLMERLVKHRGVTVEGNMEPHLEWIKTAAEGKSGRGVYGTGYELLISVEDMWFGPDVEQEVTGFMEREVLTLPLSFDFLHVVGFTGRLFLSFPLSGLRTKAGRA